MARTDSRTLSLTISPRTSNKMIPEISLLIEHLTGEKWSKGSQCASIEILREESFFNGKGEKDPSSNARDRINRAPKSLGFVRLSPMIELTPVGEKLIASRRKDEVFLHRILKLQISFPYHKPSNRATKLCIEPYLEMLRLARTMGTLKLDELQVLGIQLTDWHDFENIVHKTETFRIKEAEHKGSYRVFRAEYLNTELRQIYKDRIEQGMMKIRESADTLLEKSLYMQSSSMRDYADSCFRYLRATGLVNVSQVGKSLSVIPERTNDVDHLLGSIESNPLSSKSEAEYCSYLDNASIPILPTDNRDNLIKKLKEGFAKHTIPTVASTEELKDLLGELRDEQREKNIKDEVRYTKEYELYDDIQSMFGNITARRYYDNPIMLEWNMWRAMTMLDEGNIRVSLNFDDFGKSLSTATGNMVDIVCDYGGFLVTVEVTMASGQKRFEMGGEPVSGHPGKLEVLSGKPRYCLFIALAINDATISFFYMLYKTNLVMYGGKSTVMLLPLSFFQKMIEDSYKVSYFPKPNSIKAFSETSETLAEKADNEVLWYRSMQEKAMDWLE